MVPDRKINLDTFLLQHEADYPFAIDELRGLFRNLSDASKIISHNVNKAGLVDILGVTGSTNVHGEEVKKLDIFANQQLIQSLQNGGYCYVLASEENEDVIPVPQKNGEAGCFSVLIDPLDGSSNIDVNVSIGTIFSVYRREKAGSSGALQDVLRSGNRQVAAGYFIYGSGTMLVYTCGKGVHGFTLDPDSGEFLLSYPSIRIPSKGKIYSLNEGNCMEFSEGLKRYLDHIRRDDKATGRPYSSRYIGSLVADFHRNLLKGGIFIYPATAKAKKGKLRLMYEANPLSFVVEQAGGWSTDGSNRILDIQPGALHERTPLYIGSKEDVKLAGEFLAKYDTVTA